MKVLIDSANEYVKKSDWKDIALIKLCLCSMGIMIGTSVSKKAKKPVVFGALGVFIVTYIALMTKFLKIFTDHLPKVCRTKEPVAADDAE